MPIDIAGLAVRRAAPPAVRGGGQTTPVRIKKLPDGRICASATYRGAAVQVVLPKKVSRIVTVGGTQVGSTYDVGRADYGMYDIGAEAIIGNIWNSIAKGVAQLHHSKLVQNVAAGALALYGVPPGITKRGMQMTGDLLDKARAGSPRHRERIAEIGTRARQGDATARTAAQALLHRNRADRRARAAMDLLNRAQLGNPRAQAAVQQIEARATRGDSRAKEAQRAMQAVLDASSGRLRPPPPVVPRRATGRPPAPPARAARGLPGAQGPRGPAVGPLPSRVLTLQNARVLRERRGPDGKRQLLVQVGGAGLDWLKNQLGYHRAYRGEAEATTIRELYLQGLTG